MKLSSTIRRIVKAEGKKTMTAKTIIKLKNSREFGYLVDTKR